MKQLFKSSVAVAALAGIIILLSMNHQRMLRMAASSQSSVQVKNQATAATPVRTSVSLRPASLPVAAAPSKSCNIEEIGGVQYTKPYEVPRGLRLSVSGWLLDTDARNVPDKASLYVIAGTGAGAWSTPIEMDVERSDVAKLNGGLSAYQRSGFAVDVEINSLTPGTYHLLLIYGANGSGHVCDNGRVLRIGS